ncbi:MAG: hypothetical protein MSF41_03530 [Oscillibacter sp.]|nr:hypothetical protein [Oscillibacter sp.]
MKTRRLVIRVAAVLVLIIVGIIMSIIGRGHTIYLDNKTLEYNGQTYKAPYKVTIYVGDEQLTKLYDKERGSTTCLGQTFTVTLEVMETKNGSEEMQTYKIPVPKNMDGVIINIPGYLAGLPEEAYLSEFIAAPTEDIGDDEVPGGEGDDLIPTDM